VEFGAKCILQVALDKRRLIGLERIDTPFIE
jgi:hypothetical protein